MKREKYTQMSETLSHDIESIVFTQGKQVRIILRGDRILFTIYEVWILGTKWFALEASEDAFKLLGVYKNESELLLIVHGKKNFNNGLAKILALYEPMEFLAA